jgi:hypothetical protein
MALADVNRRTVVRGAAWTVPVVVVATQAPAFAASPCAPVPFPAGWSTPGTSGSFNAATGTQGYLTTYASDGINRFVSERDNASTGSEAITANAAIVSLQTTLTLTPGRPYTFSFSVASRFASDNPSSSQNQFLQVQTIAGSTTTDQLRLVKGTNSNTYFGSLATWQQLSSTTPGVQVQTVAFTFTPPTGATSVVLKYLFTSPGRGRATGGTFSGGGDIAITAPTITGC